MPVAHSTKYRRMNKIAHGLISAQLLEGGGGSVAAPGPSHGAVSSMSDVTHPAFAPVVSFAIGAAVVYTTQPSFAVARHADGYRVSVVRVALIGCACAGASWLLMKRL